MDDVKQYLIVGIINDFPLVVDALVYLTYQFSLLIFLQKQNQNRTNKQKTPNIFNFF